LQDFLQYGSKTFFCSGADPAKGVDQKDQSSKHSRPSEYSMVAHDIESRSPRVVRAVSEEDEEDLHNITITAVDPLPKSTAEAAVQTDVHHSPRGRSRSSTEAKDKKEKKSPRTKVPSVARIVDPDEGQLPPLPSFVGKLYPPLLD